jgi:Lhr-like helicase
MDEFVVKLREFGDPSSLTIIELLRLPEVQEVQMVRINLNLMQGSMEIVSPFSQGTNNAEELSIVDFVSLFSGIKGF